MRSILRLSNKTESNVNPLNNGKAIHVGNSGIEREGLGDGKAVNDGVSEGVGESVAVSEVEEEGYGERTEDVLG
jgi:hypothetical protein